MLREQNCYIVIFLPWSISFENVVKIVHDKVSAVPFHMGLIILQKKKKKHPKTLMILF